MARHDQRVEIKPWICLNCHELKCNECIDRLIAQYKLHTQTLCTCKHPYEIEQAIAEAVEEAHANPS